MDIEDGNIDLYLIFIDQIDPDYLDRYFLVLSPNEKTRYDKLSFGQDKKRHLITKAGCRLILQKYLGIPPASIDYEVTKYGRPFISQDQNPIKIDFNISHSGNLIVVGVLKNVAIGVDTEHVDRDIPIDVSNLAFSPKEQNSIMKDNQKAMKFWTLKESYIKALGNGMSYPLKKITCNIDLGKISVSDLGNEDTSRQGDFIIIEYKKMLVSISALFFPGNSTPVCINIADNLSNSGNFAIEKIASSTKNVLNIRRMQPSYLSELMKPSS